MSVVNYFWSIYKVIPYLIGKNEATHSNENCTGVLGILQLESPASPPRSVFSESTAQNDWQEATALSKGLLKNEKNLNKSTFTQWKFFLNKLEDSWTILLVARNCSVIFTPVKLKKNKKYSIGCPLSSDDQKQKKTAIMTLIAVKKGHFGMFPTKFVTKRLNYPDTNAHFSPHDISYSHLQWHNCEATSHNTKIIADNEGMKIKCSISAICMAFRPNLRQNVYTAE